MDYRFLSLEELSPGWLKGFSRRQVVTRVLRGSPGHWHEEDCPFIDDWDEENLCRVERETREIVQNSGTVAVAIENGRVYGLALLCGRPMEDQPVPTLQLDKCHVSSEARHRGIGTRLFAMICIEAKERGAAALYLSAHSAVESQAFYRSVGCVDAAVPNAEAVLEEPCDIQMTRDLSLPAPTRVLIPEHSPVTPLRFVVICAFEQGIPLWCRHRERDTWELPGGHIEPGETPEEAARRELWEETGATDFTLTLLTVYGAATGAHETFGMLWRAEVNTREALPPLEIAEVRAAPEIPGPWTYPQIQPILKKYLTKQL